MYLDVGREDVVGEPHHTPRALRLHATTASHLSTRDKPQADLKGPSAGSDLALGHLVVHEVLEALARGLRHLLELFAVGRRRRQRERVRVLHPNPVYRHQAAT